MCLIQGAYFMNILSLKFYTRSISDCHIKLILEDYRDIIELEFLQDDLYQKMQPCRNFQIFDDGEGPLKLGLLVSHSDYD